MLRFPLLLPEVFPATPAVDRQPFPLWEQHCHLQLVRIWLFSPREGCSREDAIPDN